MLPKLLLTVASASTALLATTWVHADGRPAPECDRGLIEPAAMTVPANIPSFAVSSPTEPDIRLFEAPDTARAVRVEGQDGRFTLVPDGLTAGKQYRFEYTRTCDGAAEQAGLSFTVGPSAPLPTTMGTLSLTELRAVNNGLAGPEYRTYYIDLLFTPAAEMDPWKAVYGYDAPMDGATPKGFTGDMNYAVQKPRMFINCGGAYASYPDLPKGGHHSITLVARMRGNGEAEVRTNTVEFDIDCDRALRVDPVTDAPLTAEQIAKDDARAQPQAPTNSPSDTSACSMRRGPPTLTSATGLLWLAMSLLAVVARRRQTQLVRRVRLPSGKR